MKRKLMNDHCNIAVLGLGYVGLPLSVAFGKKFSTIGFDIDISRVEELSAGVDRTLECERFEIEEAGLLSFSSRLEELKQCNIYIVTVPTPIDTDMQPDLGPLISASRMVGKVISKEDVVVFESTVYPGATEEVCIPEIEKVSGLELNIDFYAGYSPERINPGDKINRLESIVKVTSGSTSKAAEFVDSLYSEIITAGTFMASSIRVAEASKIIENVQRDVNIALVNELHQIFSLLNIDTNKVIEAAATKWNFMKLSPGLVGGHCIGVDPYYLLHKSTSVGYIPDLIRTARTINNGMPKYLVDSFIKAIIKNNISPIGCSVLLMGFSFKENCSDIRNTKVYDLYIGLKEFGLTVDIYDPLVAADQIRKEYGIRVITEISELGSYQCGILSVPHDVICEQLVAGKISFDSSFIYDFKKKLTWA
ncbi:nucleotide sugar dehydrogenase [Porticoccaceae bacterium]|nr:nucleotide sugar dehydrogenase [Porticoccaceae bacterium]